MSESFSSTTLRILWVAPENWATTEVPVAPWDNQDKEGKGAERRVRPPRFHSDRGETRTHHSAPSDFSSGVEMGEEPPVVGGRSEGRRLG